MKTAVLLLLAAAAFSHAADGEAFFESKIRPLLIARCYDCHSGEKHKGGLALDSRDGWQKGGDSGTAIVPGDPEASLLIKAVRHGNPDLAMPPADKGGKLTDADIANLTEWVRLGAPDPREAEKKIGGMKAAEVPHWWAFQPLSQATANGQEKIDALLNEKLATAGKSPAPRADAATLIRRATYDLTGLPPTAEEIAEFVAESAANAPSAWQKLIDRLLASPHYGEQWGRHWLDVVRYADTAGETADYPAPLAWRYRNYVIDAFNADKSYHDFIREQIAGDILAERGPRENYAEQATAAGYLAISRRFGFDSENYHHLTIQDTIDNVGQSVLGLTLGCARCHDHKYDPVTIRDYYALYGIFDSSRFAFPGSEQKQKSRSVAPLQPAAESLQTWRAYDQRVAMLATHLEKENHPAPSVVLRSLHDADGDFEMQAAASGGSKGVLVSPWLAEGRIDVAAGAQSPFRHVFPRGKVGAHVVGGTTDYRIRQGLHPRHTAENSTQLYCNLDFRIAAAAKEGRASKHRLRLGPAEGSPAVELWITPDALTDSDGRRLAALKPGEWNSLQVTLNLKERRFTGKLNTTSTAAELPGGPFVAGWSGIVDFVILDVMRETDAALPDLDLDNFAVQDFPIREATTDMPALPAITSVGDESAAIPALQDLVRMDSGVDFQEDNAVPAAPWHGGPNSVVKISGAAQSPFRNLLPAGRFGIHMPNRAEYDGFGQSLTGIQPDEEGRLFVSFDFRCADAAKGGDGSWRYYLGNGPGNSAAVELFFNATQFFPRDGDAREPLASLKIGVWYQVQLALNTKARTYTGTLISSTEKQPFSGKMATGWNGKLDYTFIDSYGHRGGVRPALDADNFVIRAKPLPAAGEVATAEIEQYREAAERLRQKITATREQSGQLKKELETLLLHGPEEGTYGMAEGTPQDARMQLRGEPDRLGDVVPRGFVSALGGGVLPVGTSGSGRLELANWLTSHPLTARVMVNRIWQYHFGRGLVATPNDFGARGLRPTHPELLEHLAAEFVRSGWSIKNMHRRIMHSDAYQRASGDADGYASFPRRRLSAEEVRDAILAVSGDLDRSPGQEHPFPSPLGWAYTQHGPFAAVYDHDKRSIYLMVQRIKRHPFLALFDGADPNSSTPHRSTSTVPTQALFFLNDPFVHAKAGKLAARIIGQRQTEEERLTAAHRTVLGRNPDKSELADAVEFSAAARQELGPNQDAAVLAAYIRTLFGGNEFLHID